MEQDTSNEKHAEQPLCNKLEDTDSLQALLLQDKNASWEKLHNRLQQKKRRLSPAWYWAAAACLLLVSSIPLFIAKEKKPDAESDHLKNVATNTEVKIITPVEKDTVSSKNIVPAEKLVIISNKKTSADKNTTLSNEPVSPELIFPAVVEQREQPVPATAIPSVENKASEPIIAVAAPAKPALRVVHINELGIAAPERNTARAEDDGFIKFKIINTQAHTGTVATAKTIMFNISKTSSTN
jgi:hypothetical protein